MSEVRTSNFTLAERMAFGVFSIDEAVELAAVSKSKFFNDLRAGKIIARKQGGRTVIPGPNLKKYLVGDER